MIKVYMEDDAKDAARYHREEYISQVMREIEVLQDRGASPREIARLRNHLSDEYLAQQYPLAYDG